MGSFLDRKKDEDYDETEGKMREILKRWEEGDEYREWFVALKGFYQYISYLQVWLEYLTAYLSLSSSVPSSSSSSIDTSYREANFIAETHCNCLDTVSGEETRAGERISIDVIHSYLI